MMMKAANKHTDTQVVLTNACACISPLNLMFLVELSSVEAICSQVTTQSGPSDEEAGSFDSCQCVQVCESRQAEFINHIKWTRFVTVLSGFCPPVCPYFAATDETYFWTSI